MLVVCEPYLDRLPYKHLHKHNTTYSPCCKDIDKVVTLCYNNICRTDGKICQQHILKATRGIDMGYCVYKHTAPNGKVYIGITSQLPRERWKSGGRGYETQTLFYKAIKKYGWTNFKHEILYTGLTKEAAEQKEIELIKHYKSNDTNFGYNIREGGSSSLWAESSKEKLRLANLGKHCSEETKKKLHDFNIGKKIPEEVKRKISKTLTGYKRGSFTEEHRRKLSEAAKKRPIPEKQLKQLLELAANQKGENNPRARKVKQFDLENNYIKTWGCISDACRALNINPRRSGNITSCCRGDRKTAYGYIWRYEDDDPEQRNKNYLASLEKNRDQKIKYYKANKGKCLERQREYRETHRERIREYMHKYYLEHRKRR